MRLMVRQVSGRTADTSRCGVGPGGPPGTTGLSPAGGKAAAPSTRCPISTVALRPDLRHRRAGEGVPLTGFIAMDGLEWGQGRDLDPGRLPRLMRPGSVAGLGGWAGLPHSVAGVDCPLLTVPVGQGQAGAASGPRTCWLASATSARSVHETEGATLMKADRATPRCLTPELICGQLSQSVFRLRVPAGVPLHARVPVDRSGRVCWEGDPSACTTSGFDQHSCR